MSDEVVERNERADAEKAAKKKSSGKERMHKLVYCQKKITGYQDDI